VKKTKPCVMCIHFDILNYTQQAQMRSKSSSGRNIDERNGPWGRSK